MSKRKPWETEPDFVEWVDEPTGYWCRIQRNGMGVLCGYVSVPAGHSLWGIGYDSLYDIDVHGGLTYADYGPDPANPSSPAWVFGFDCGHSSDLIPSMMVYMPGGIYREIKYVTKECERLASQLAEQE